MKAKLSFNWKEMVYFTMICTAFLFFISPQCRAQAKLNNASFEDEAQDATTPQGWMECEVGTTPDILPGYWGVKTLPKDGASYVGLITRKDGSFESIGQRIHPPIQRNQCYELYVHLAKSRKYVGYTKKVKIKIWVGKEKCGRDQLIYTSPKIGHRDWKKYLIDFTADETFNFLLIEVFSEKEGQPGHVLIDAISDIKLCSKAMR